MSKPSPQGVEKLKDISRRLKQAREDEAEYKEKVQRLRAATEIRARLERDFRDQLEAMDLIVGNAGWQERLAWVMEYLIEPERADDERWRRE